MFGTKSYKFLVVDHENIRAQQLMNQLETEGYATEYVPSSQDAIQQLTHRRGAYGGVIIHCLLDNAWQLLKTIKKTVGIQKLPILMVGDSKVPAPQELNTAFELGMFDFIPDTAHELAGKVQEALYA
ncbi:MAG TPA: hypothetical protein VJB02_00645 [Coxiellaceae bacterium]|nr:hypothetical protein [Coxiellaceae bacterium]